ncbi:MAG: type II toxin-antitoxin system VapC family toxin [Candidatus Poribacteria bacterium]|nr:type II toxin-antitoxin system VapC family toxin [Candidatus Poribacteria bacterium]
MQKRIYIETTIPSAYYTLRTDDVSLDRRKLTRQWWDEYANLFILTSSSAVVEELRRGRTRVTRDRLSLLEGVEIFDPTVEIVQIARIYIEKLIMPQKPRGDALHLAVASFHGVDTLLTWNCMHLANPNKFDFIRQINREIGLPTPKLTTPLDYLGGTA